MTSAATDGRVARQRWDQACAAADDALRTSRAAAQEAGQDWLVRWFTTEVGQLATLQARVAGKRRRPGDGASGLLHDVPVDLQEPAYRPSVTALERVQELYSDGLCLPDWDWSQGFPSDWPSSAKDRLKALPPWHST